MIGCYYPCFRQTYAASQVTAAYRKYYPTTTIVMVCDAGDEKHEDIAKEVNALYFYEQEHIGYPGNQPHYDSILRWIKRFFKYIQKIPDEWFMLMEDDVLVVRKVTPDVLKYDMNGLCDTSILPPPACEYIRNKHPHITQEKLIYGAMGGTIFRTEFYKNLSNNMDQVEKEVIHFGNMCPPHLTGQNWYFSDVILTYLTYVFGGTLGHNPEFMEVWYPDASERLARNQTAIINNYKNFYR